MAIFAGTGANEVIDPDFVTESVASSPADARPSAAADVINAGGGDDTIDAGGGDDVVVGGLGADSAILGQGDDVFRSRRGDGYDRINGGQGYDSYEWTGTDEHDSFTLEVLGAGTSLQDHPQAIVNDIERIRMDMGGGDDEVALYDHAGSSLEKIEIVDSENVIIEGDSTGERLIVRQQGAVTTVTGLLAVVTLEKSEPGRLVLSSRGGDDIVNLAALGAATAPVSVNAGEGDDFILAGMRVETLVGGDGADGVSYASSSAGVEIDLSGGAGGGGSAEGDELTTFENLTGSGFGDRLGGNLLANIIAGGAGDDWIEASLGEDRLNGGAGDDVLDGGVGADLMFGAAGDDLYRVGNSGDRTIEAVGGGIDAVRSTISLTLPANVEHLSLFDGNGALSGRGNGLANEIRGNDEANMLQGRGGADVLTALDGDDTLDGGIGSDRTSGGLGDDRIYGGSGADLSRGGEGRDRFFFDTALGSGVDTIDDFTVADDTFLLSRTIFGDIAAGTLAADAFAAGTAAQDAEDRVIYHQATGRIFFDADGAGGGAAILFARVDPGEELTNLDFRGY